MCRISNMSVGSVVCCVVAVLWPGGSARAQTLQIEIGPVPGMTSEWHPAPGSANIPAGTTVQFRLDLGTAYIGRADINRDLRIDLGDFAAFALVFGQSGAGNPELFAASDFNGDGRVNLVDFATFAGEFGAVGLRVPYRWSGAVEIAFVNRVWLIEVPFGAEGPATVELQADYGNGFEQVVGLTYSVVAVDASQIAYSLAEIVPIDEYPPGMQMLLKGSIAPVDQTGPNQYLTTIERQIRLRASTDPAGFEPLIEWTVDGQVLATLGSEIERNFPDVASHAISFGSPTGGGAILVQTYRTTITTQYHPIAVGMNVTFEAVTQPPGYENYIRWYADTLRGESSVEWGTGSTISVLYSDVIRQEDGFVCYGARANHARNITEGVVILAGTDCWDTLCGQTTATFTGDDALPAGFFDPASELFDGVVQLRGNEAATERTTQVARLEDLVVPNIGLIDTTDIEIVELNLVSCAPITVVIDGQDTLWDVHLGFCGTPPLGSMTVTKTHVNGGTFVSNLNVQPVFTFTKVGDPTQVRVLNTCDEGIVHDELIMSGSASWVHKAGPNVGPISVCGANFVPGVQAECCEDVCHPGATATHCVKIDEICGPCP